MRWKIRGSGHDRRQIDLLVALAMVIVIIVLGHYFSHSPAPAAKNAFIEPSQTVRW